MNKIRYPKKIKTDNGNESGSNQADIDDLSTGKEIEGQMKPKDYQRVLQGDIVEEQNKPDGLVRDSALSPLLQNDELLLRPALMNQPVSDIEANLNQVLITENEDSSYEDNLQKRKPLDAFSGDSIPSVMTELKNNFGGLDNLDRLIVASVIDQRDSDLEKDTYDKYVITKEANLIDHDIANYMSTLKEQSVYSSNVSPKIKRRSLGLLTENTEVELRMPSEPFNSHLGSFLSPSEEDLADALKMNKLATVESNHAETYPESVVTVPVESLDKQELLANTLEAPISTVSEKDISEKNIEKKIDLEPSAGRPVLSAIENVEDTTATKTIHISGIVEENPLVVDDVDDVDDTGIVDLVEIVEENFSNSSRVCFQINLLICKKLC